MGKFCFGNAVKNAGAARLSQSKAFCEGMGYRASGTLLSAPLADNPHLAGSPDGVSWATGWNISNDSAGGKMPKGDEQCCAYPGAIAA